MSTLEQREYNGRLLEELWQIGERLVPQGEFTECHSSSCPILGPHNTDECADILKNGDPPIPSWPPERA